MWPKKMELPFKEILKTLKSIYSSRLIKESPTKNNIS